MKNSGPRELIHREGYSGASCSTDGFNHLNGVLSSFRSIYEQRNYWHLMTSLTTETGGEASLKDTSPPPVSDSGVSNGSSLCLSESGAPLSTEQAMEPTTTTTTTSAGTELLAQNSLCVRVEDSMEKGLSCLSLEVCASGDNLNMLNQDDLSGCLSGPGSMGSMERVGLRMGGEEEERLGRGVPKRLSDGEEEIVALQDMETCGDAGDGMYVYVDNSVYYVLDITVLVHNSTGM